MTITFNNIFAAIVLIAFMGFNLAAIPKLFRQVLFYKSFAWDFSKDSGRVVIFQDGLANRFSSLPIGFVKMKVLLTQIIIGLLPLLMVWNGLHH